MIPLMDLSGKQKLFKCDPLMGLCEIEIEVIHRKTKALNCVISTLNKHLVDCARSLFYITINSSLQLVQGILYILRLDVARTKGLH